MQERMKRFFLGKKFSQTSNTRHVVIDCKIDPSVGDGGKTWRITWKVIIDPCLALRTRLRDESK
jgi:hypothetical protein